MEDKRELQLYQIKSMIEKMEELNQKCTENMNRLNAMMLEMKGLTSMIRPQVKKTGWYGEEIRPAQVLRRPDNSSDYPPLESTVPDVNRLDFED